MNQAIGMAQFINNSTSKIYDTGEKVGVLLVNLGSPDQPDTSSVKHYLAEFLSDPRVVEFPRWLWWLVLKGIILRVRPARSAKVYRKIWTEQGSPLLVNSKKQRDTLQERLAHRFSGAVVCELAMRYGHPSIAQALDRLSEQSITRLLVLPLYPQYSATTTASVIDGVSQQLAKRRFIPELRWINHYASAPGYIQALADSVRRHWGEKGRQDKLLLSFHGIPERYVKAGDPYEEECKTTARLLAEALALKPNEWMLVFQSRFGREPWLQPYCDQTLESLPSQGVKSVDILCPGFSSDCLETLEEINMENRQVFFAAGGQRYEYIPALNADEQHMQFLETLVCQHLQGWLP